MSTLQSLQNHLDAVKVKHRELDKQIEIEYNTYIRDEIVDKHKIEKLKLKDEIRLLEKQIEDRINNGKE
jgi:uncharacterized protein YdcH (DUF465 family)